MIEKALEFILWMITIIAVLFLFFYSGMEWQKRIDCTKDKGKYSFDFSVCIK
jgi:heme/copper-type cytochrome/quinol oxidase subunit 2